MTVIRSRTAERRLRRAADLRPHHLPDSIQMRCGAGRCDRSMGKATRLPIEVAAESGSWDGLLFEPVRQTADGNYTCSGFLYVPEPSRNTCSVVIEMPGRDPIVVANTRTIEVTTAMPSGAKRSQIKFAFACNHCGAHHSLQNVTLTRLIVDAVMRGDRHVVIP